MRHVVRYRVRGWAQGRVMELTTTSSHRDALKLLSVKEAAGYLNVTDTCMQTLIANHRIPYHRLGQTIRLDPRDVDTLLRRHRVDRADDGRGESQREPALRLRASREHGVER